MHGFHLGDSTLEWKKKKWEDFNDRLSKVCNLISLHGFICSSMILFSFRIFSSLMEFFFLNLPFLEQSQAAKIGSICFLDNAQIYHQAYTSACFFLFLFVMLNLSGCCC